MALSLPLDGKITITSRFGFREPVPGVKADTSNHLGTDLRAAVGTIVRASGTGIVYAFRQFGRYTGPAIFTAPLSGNWLIVRYGAVYVVYAHLTATKVGLGQVVEAGQEIARTGSSGGVAPHLHVGVWTRLGTTWTAHDPEQFFEFVPKASAPLTPTAPSEEDDMASLSAEALEGLEQFGRRFGEFDIARFQTGDVHARRGLIDKLEGIAAAVNAKAPALDVDAIADEVVARLGGDAAKIVADRITERIANG